MRKIIYIVLIVLIAIAAGCTPSINEEKETTVGTTGDNGDFMLSIWADKSTYKADEPISCFASVTYLGEDTITVYHSNPLVVFYIEGDKFNGDWAREDSLNRTEFTLQQETVVPFQKNGGWSADDPDAEFFKEFYSEKELKLPPGQYKLWAQIEYSTNENDMRGTMSELKVSVSVTVK